MTVTQGSRTAQAVVRLAPREVSRPLTVVGRLPRTRFSTEEVWIHPDGKHAYLGSGGGGDVMYAIDISDPSKPTVTDSVISNTRRVNDVMTTPDGKFLVFTREGASDRKNGIVICSLEDPKHPKVISEFTDGVTSGVHSAFIYKQERYGTHIYLTNDGTGALHVIDINDPYHPKEVAQWKTPKTHGNTGRTLHDIDVQNGLLYASYWNDGLVVLDVGAGIKGGAVIGKSNATGTAVADREVYSGHLWHTYLQAVGLDSTKNFYPSERPVPIADPKTAAIKEILA